MSTTNPFRILALCLIALLAPLNLPPATTLAQTDQRCFPETGQCISGRIRTFWEQNGGLAIFGFPISPQQGETIEGQTRDAQWFERHRLELHPEHQRPYDVQISRLGVERLALQARDWQHFAKTAPRAGCRFFVQTGHTICGDILTAWRTQGLEIDGKRGKTEAENLALFGLPLSEPIAETLSDGKTYTVQWFERARFEIHPENQPPHIIQFGLLGNEIHSTPSPPPSSPTDMCAHTPNAISARIRPGPCIQPGERLIIDIFGFQPNEDIGYWITTPNGSIFGTIQTVTIGPTGAIDEILFATTGLDTGLWYIVFQGTQSNHQSVVYLSITTPS